MKKKLSLLVKSLHPAHSRQLSERLLGQTISFYFTFVIVGLLLMLGIFMGLNWNKPFDINQLDASKTITLVDRPKVTLGPALNESESFLAFTPQEVGYDRFIFFGRTSSIYKNELTLLLLPGIVLLIGAISLGFSIILALLSSAIAFASTRKHKTSFRDLLVINFHYQAPVLLLFFVLFAFWNYAFFVLLLYLFNYIIGVMLLTNKKFKSVAFS